MERLIVDALEVIALLFDDESALVSTQEMGMSTAPENRDGLPLDQERQAS